MRYLWVLFLLTLPTSAWAARVCVERGTGKLIEYQSHATPGTLLRNAKAAGYQEAQVEEREVTSAEWTALQEQWIDAPNRAAAIVQAAQRQSKAAIIRAKLGLSAQEFEELKEALR